jgi:hypothetical protein
MYSWMVSLNRVISRRKRLSFLAIAFFFLAVAGCENHGKLQRNPELTRSFENHSLPQDYAYYYYGRDNMPYALVGIAPEFRLQSELWQAVGHQSDRFRGMIRWVWTEHNYAPYGAHILGPGGERIGIWYSSITHAAINLNKTEKTVAIIPDKPFLRDGPGK